MFKKFVSATLVALALSVTGPRVAPSAPSPVIGDVRAPLPALQGDAARAELDRRGLATSLGAAIESARYAARPVADAAQTYVVENVAQGLRGVFAADRAVVSGGGRQVTLRPVEIAFGTAESELTDGVVTADGNRTEIARTLTGASGALVRVDEWWVNRPTGIEQGFTVHAPPGSKSEGDWLTVALAMESDLSPRLTDDAQAVEFVDEAGAARLRYDHLVVVDAAGRELPSRMRLDGAVLRLETDDTGAVYPVTIDPTWTQQVYLKASNTRHSNFFGQSVAIAGDTVVVGAYQESSAATGVNGNQTSTAASASGAAYVFVRTGGTWTQQAYLKASNTGADDLFGVSVAIAGDTLVVGAWAEDSAATGIDGDQTSNAANASGAAYVFVRTGGTWTQQAYLKASNTSSQFGGSVAIAGDTVVVGAYNEGNGATGVNGNQASGASASSGAAYVFVRTGGTWMQQAYLKASNTGAQDFFGYSVAVAGDTVVVGAHGEDSAATGVNGDQASNDAARAGAAYVFVRAGMTWTQQAYLKASNTGAGDEFGESVAVAGDTVVVAAEGEDSAATGVNGDETSNVATDSGAAYVFVRNGGTWTQQAYLKASNTDASDLFGHSVAVAGDSVVVGAMREASAATGVNGDQSSNAAASAGAAYVFVRSGVTWAQQVYLKASNTEARDEFGRSVAVAGDTVVVSAVFEDSAATGVNGDQTSNAAPASGAAYVFLMLADPPSAPTGVVGTAGNGQVSVAFTAPSSNGGSAITGYTVTASPGGATATGIASPIVVTGLTNGTGYTFTVTATNAAGTGAASAPSSAVTPTLTVTAPTMAVNPLSLRFAATKNGAAGAITSVTGAQTVSVAFSTGSPAWTVSASQPWVSLSASGGTGTSTFTVSISDPGNVIAGSTSLPATITLTSATASNSPRTIAVTLAVDQTNGAATAVAIGGFDSPSDNATGVVGAIAVTGWALDDIGVERVEIWRNCLTPIDSSRAGVCRTATPMGAADRVFIGTAAFVPGARTDIETNPIYAGYPQAYRAGWGYLLLTNALPNQSTGVTEGGQGPITLYAYAIDREGRYTELGSKAVTLNNDNATVPFGAIDTPEQGGTVTAAVSANFGWAMTRRRNAAGVDIPKCIERTRYRVFVDGVARTLTTGGNWHPNLVRADLTAAYPGLCDSANSLAAYYLDVAALGLANGTHTIGWDVYDDNGTPGNTADDNVAGIGSRFFNILVGAADAPVEDRLRDRPARRGAASDITALPTTESRELRARVGAVEAPVVAIDGDPAGRHAVNLPQGSRLTVDLDGVVTRGYLVVGDELRDLPIGSTLDAARGHFYWQPAVPYFGAFELVFVSATERGGEARTTLEVTIADPTAGGDPAITIASPITGANPNPVIAVTGTARDPQAVSGTGIETVHVWAYRSDVAGVPPQFLGAASLKGEGYALTTAPLAAGSYDVAVFAWVTRTGTWAPAAVVNIAVR